MFTKDEDRLFEWDGQPMGNIDNSKYILTSGSKVREEEFGLLFYNMYGPRLFFINCGKSLAPEFFKGKYDLKQWLTKQGDSTLASAGNLAQCLRDLAEKGVIRGV